jgi:SNF2 family DNA or RNA helicase
MSLLVRRRLWAFFEALFSNELTADSPRAVTPDWIRTPLLPHQQACFAAALRLEGAKAEGLPVDPIAGEPAGGRLYSSHGILADSVGSGKSLTALALVRAPPPPATYTEFSIRSQGAMLGDGRDVGLLRQRSQITQNITGISLTPVHACLFIIPHPLINQWESYIESDSTLRARFVKKKNDACAEDFMTTLNTYDAIFVSSTMFSTLRAAHPIHTIMWKRVFMDEADSISLSTLNDEINGLFYWFISASWMNLVFSTGAYFNIGTALGPFPETPPEVVRRVNNLMGGPTYLSLPGVRHINLARKMCGFMVRESVYGMSPVHYQSARLIIHSSDSFIKESFRQPIINHTEIICETPHNIRVLNEHISADMLERLNAGDVRGALEELGMPAYSEAGIIEAITDSLKKDLDNAKKTHDYKQSIEYATEASKAKALEACAAKIASIESRITAIQERIKSAKSQSCPICYCDISGTAVVPCCQQVFCFACICAALQRAPTCPLCRHRIESVKDVRVIGTPKEAADLSGNLVVFGTDESKTPEKLSKRDAFLKYVGENRTARILMFSSYDATFGVTEEHLRRMEIPFAHLTGSQARINKLLKDFKEGKYTVLFLNARHMGAGLNIDCATHVILYHKMNAELTNQIVGRAVRLGRTADLEVVHLLHENERGTRISHV